MVSELGKSSRSQVKVENVAGERRPENVKTSALQSRRAQRVEEEKSSLVRHRDFALTVSDDGRCDKSS